MNRKSGVLAIIVIATVMLFTLCVCATDAQMYFSSDKNGQNRVTNIQEGDSVWIVIIDNDENTLVATPNNYSTSITWTEPDAQFFGDICGLALWETVDNVPLPRNRRLAVIELVLETEIYDPGDLPFPVWIDVFDEGPLTCGDGECLTTGWETVHIGRYLVDLVR